MAEALEGNSQKGVPIQAGATPTDDQGGWQPHKCSDAFLKIQLAPCLQFMVSGGNPPTQGKSSQLILPPGLCSQDQSPITKLLPSSFARAPRVTEEPQPSTCPASTQARSLLHLHLVSLNSLLGRAGSQEARKASCGDTKPICVALTLKAKH